MENHPDAVAAHFLQARLRGVEHVLAVELHDAVRVKSLRIGQQLEDGECGHGFAGSGFAHQRDSLAVFNAKRHAAHGLNCMVFELKMHAQILHFEQAHASPGCDMVLRTSNASRTASPMNTSSDNMIASTKNPDRPSHGACKLRLP